MPVQVLHSHFQLSQAISREIWCLVEGDIKPFSIDIPFEADTNVYDSDLKKLVLKKRFSGQGGLVACDLILQRIKDSQPIALNSSDFLARVKLLTNDSDAVVGLAVSVLDIFHDLPVNHLHIQVIVPPIAAADCHHLFLGTTAFSDSLQVARGIYDALWGKSLNDFICEASTDIGRTSVHYRYFSRTFIQACQLFHLKFTEQVLLVREEYASIYEMLRSRPQRGGVVVTGQPGIGKTCSIFFVLFQRLSAALPTAIQMHDNRFYLFTSQGASVLSADSENAYRLPAGTWALSASTHTIVLPCSAFLDATMDVFVVHVSPPNRALWRHWKKYRGNALRIETGYQTKKFASIGVLPVKILQLGGKCRSDGLVLAVGE